MSLCATLAQFKGTQAIRSDGKLDFEEFKAMVANTDVARTLTLEDLF